jgi:hypothetical protein
MMVNAKPVYERGHHPAQAGGGFLSFQQHSSKCEGEIENVQHSECEIEPHSGSDF